MVRDIYLDDWGINDQDNLICEYCHQTFTMESWDDHLEGICLREDWPKEFMRGKHV